MEQLNQTFLTIGETLNSLTVSFEAAGIETARLDARLIVQHALGLSHEEVVLFPDRFISDLDNRVLQKFITRRLHREPVSRIVGETEFWSLPFFISKETLDPRPDTETLVETVLELASHARNSPLRILDLGTGSGCILLSLLSEFEKAVGIGVDLHKGALETACLNAERLQLTKRVKFIESDWFQDVSGRFDIVVSNPPYVAMDEKDELAPEVIRYDPHSALFAADKGLREFERIFAQLSGFLNPNAFICFEVGKGQANDVKKLLKQSSIQRSIKDITIRSDLAGVERVVAARLH